MAAHLTEEEQLEALKRWFQRNGTALLLALVVVAVGFFGWNQYKKHLQRQAEAASGAYAKMMEAEGEAAVAAARELIEQFGSSLYADFARFEEARLAVEAGDLDTARQRLQHVVDNAADAGLKPLARLRLAKVLAAQGEFDAALKQFDGEAPGAFVSAYAEAKGDILMAQDRLAEARTAYESALTALTDPRSMRRGLVQLKLDNTRVADAAPADSPPAAAAPAEEG